LQPPHQRRARGWIGRKFKSSVYDSAGNRTQPASVSGVCSTNVLHSNYFAIKWSRVLLLTSTTSQHLAYKSHVDLKDEEQLFQKRFNIKRRTKTLSSKRSGTWDICQQHKIWQAPPAAENETRFYSDVNSYSTLTNILSWFSKLRHWATYARRWTSPPLVTLSLHFNLTKRVDHSFESCGKCLKQISIVEKKTINVMWLAPEQKCSVGGKTTWRWKVHNVGSWRPVQGLWLNIEECDHWAEFASCFINTMATKPESKQITITVCA